MSWSTSANAVYAEGAMPIEDDNARDVVLAPLHAEQEALLDRLCTLKASTLPGFTARANTLALRARDLLIDDAPGSNWSKRMLSAFLHDMTEKEL